MGKVLDEKCLGCGASVKYNPKLKKFICDYCHSEWTLDDIKKNKEKINKTDKLTKEFNLMEDMEGYQCKNCGAEIISLDNISSTTCLYCKSSAIIKNRLTGIYKPDSIIPFKYTKEDAIDAFKNLCKGRPLIPSAFKNVNNIQDMEGLYVPFWLYDCSNDAYLRCSCTKVTSWMDSRYVYTKTDTFDVERGGNLTFKSVPNDAATRFDDKIMNCIEPFNYEEFVKFEPEYLAGFLSEKYDVPSDIAYKNASERIKEDSKNYLRNDMKGYTTIVNKENNNNLTINETKYVFLPVYVLNFKYNNKIYHFAMNGQTKKMVGEIPVDNKKLILLIILTLIVSFFIILGLFLLNGYRW